MTNRLSPLRFTGGLNATRLWTVLNVSSGNQSWTCHMIVSIACISLINAAYYKGARMVLLHRRRQRERDHDVQAPYHART